MLVRSNRSCAAVSLALPVLLVGGHAVASVDDLAPPAYRGAAQSTSQAWDFSSGPGGGAPDAGSYSNPYGTPNLFPVGPAVWEPAGGFGSVPRPQVWELFPGASLCVENKNVPVEFPFSPALSDGGCKVADFAFTYSGAAPTVEVLPISGEGDFTSTLDSILTISLADGWTYARYSFTLFLPPGGHTSPSAELFKLSYAVLPGPPPPVTTVIDGLVIDTLALPTPSAAGLIALGGLVTLRRRR